MSQVKLTFARAVPKQTQIYNHAEKNIFTFEMLELLFKLLKMSCEFSISRLFDTKCFALL